MTYSYELNCPIGHMSPFNYMNVQDLSDYFMEISSSIEEICNEDEVKHFHKLIDDLRKDVESRPWTDEGKEEEFLIEKCKIGFSYFRDRTIKIPLTF